VVLMFTGAFASSTNISKSNNLKHTPHENSNAQPTNHVKYKNMHYIMYNAANETSCSIRFNAVFNRIYWN